MPVVAVYAYEGISPFHLSVPCLVFGEDRSSFGIPVHDVRICADRIELLKTKVGMDIIPTHDLSGMRDADIIIVPSWPVSDTAASDELICQLKLGLERGAVILGLCLGTFGLASAGLLTGKRVTTHWAHCNRLASLYPTLNVEPGVLYVDEGQILTSAGVAAGLDCCLHLLRRLYGAKAASQVARHLVLSPHRQGGQAQFIQKPIIKSKSADAFTQTLEWVQLHLSEAHTIDEVASRCGLTRRTFTRRFQRTFGESFGPWLIHQRLLFAQQSLETTDLSLEMIAFTSGFGSTVSLRKHFYAHLGISPSHYRKSFSYSTSSDTRPRNGKLIIPKGPSVLKAQPTRVALNRDISAPNPSSK